jgi:hypothetical protein
MEENNTIRFKRYPMPHEKIEELAKDFNISKEEATSMYFNMLTMAIDIVQKDNEKQG